MEEKSSMDPPFTNRGVLRTEEDIKNLDIIEENYGFLEKQNKLPFLEESYLLVDWIQATIMQEDLSVYNLFKNLFGIPPKFVVKEASGFFGYDTTYSFRNIKILTAEYRKLEGIGNMGYHIYITGSGCRDLEDLNINYQQLFKKILNYNANFTRLDISVDSFTDKYFTIPLIKKAIRNRCVVSRFRSSIEFVKTKLEDSSNDGYTIWFGSRASNIQIVFYDKLKERESQNYIVSNDIKKWIRLECRFRSVNACEMAKNLANLNLADFKTYYKGIISNYIRFVKENENDSNKRRWKTVDWWDRFLGDVERIQFQRVNVENTITKRRAWCIDSTSRNNLMCLISEMEFLTIDDIMNDFLFDMLKTGTTRITEKELQYVNDLRLQRGKVTIQKEELQDFIQEIYDFMKERKIGV